MSPLIFYEDDCLLVCEKPPGTPSQSDKTTDPDMVSLLKNYLHESAFKKGEPYLAVVHRLDRPVGGIMVFAKTPFAAAGLSRQIQDRIIRKSYLAVLCGDLSKDLLRARSEPVLLTDCIRKDARTNLSQIVPANDKNGRKAQLSYRIAAVLPAESPPLSLAEIELLTGRHHQIRVQMSSRGYGIWGDTKYNPLFREKSGWQDMALYAYRIQFYHPKTKKLLCFQNLPANDIFKRFGNNLLNI